MPAWMYKKPKKKKVMKRSPGSAEDPHEKRYKDGLRKEEIKRTSGFFPSIKKPNTFLFEKERKLLPEDKKRMKVLRKRREKMEARVLKEVDGKNSASGIENLSSLIRNEERKATVKFRKKRLEEADGFDVEKKKYLLKRAEHYQKKGEKEHQKARNKKTASSGFEGIDNLNRKKKNVMMRIKDVEGKNKTLKKIESDKGFEKLSADKHFNTKTKDTEYRDSAKKKMYKK